MKLTVSSFTVPPGTYPAKLTGLETTNHEQFGPGLRFSFVVATGEFEGKRVVRTTGCSLSPGNALGTLVSGLLGRALELDEEIELDSLLGRDCLIRVAETKGGATRVEQVDLPPIA
jgi:hypothetical protein